jgi:hypothetical protein
MEWPTPFVVLVDPRIESAPPPGAGSCDLEERSDELYAQLQAARLTEASEVMLVIQRTDLQGRCLPTLWADLTAHARGAAEQRRRSGNPTEVELHESLVRGATSGLDGWLSFCRRAALSFPDLPYTCCRVTDLSLEIHHFDS